MKLGLIQVVKKEISRSLSDKEVLAYSLLAGVAVLVGISSVGLEAYMGGHFIIAVLPCWVLMAMAWNCRKFALLRRITPKFTLWKRLRKSGES